MSRPPGSTQCWTLVLCRKTGVPYDTLAVLYHTLGVSYSTLLETKASARQTKPTVTVFVLPIKYAHICDIVTQKACHVITFLPKIVWRVTFFSLEIDLSHERNIPSALVHVESLDSDHILIR